MNKAFTLLETMIAIALFGLMAILANSYINVSTISNIQTKSQLQSQITLIQSLVLQCKTLSEAMPSQANDAAASTTSVNALTCKTFPPYNLDGGKGAFIPKAPNGFETITATESGSEFFITLTTQENSSGDEVLKSLMQTYTPTQAELVHDAGKAKLNIYLAR